MPFERIFKTGKKCSVVDGEKNAFDPNTTNRPSPSIATGRKVMGGSTVPRGRVCVRRHRVLVNQPALCAERDYRTRERLSQNLDAQVVRDGG